MLTIFIDASKNIIQFILQLLIVKIMARVEQRLQIILNLLWLSHIRLLFFFFNLRSYHLKPPLLSHFMLYYLTQITLITFLLRSLAQLIIVIIKAYAAFFCTVCFTNCWWQIDKLRARIWGSWIMKNLRFCHIYIFFHPLYCWQFLAVDGTNCSMKKMILQLLYFYLFFIVIAKLLVLLVT